MNNLFHLTGKFAVVTGGNRGLGKEVALDLANAGANIVIITRKIEGHVIQEIEKRGVKAVGIHFN